MQQVNSVLQQQCCAYMTSPTLIYSKTFSLLYNDNCESFLQINAYSTLGQLETGFNTSSMLLTTHNFPTLNSTYSIMFTMIAYLLTLNDIRIS